MDWLKLSMEFFSNYLLKIIEPANLKWILFLICPILLFLKLIDHLPLNHKYDDVIWVLWIVSIVMIFISFSRRKYREHHVLKELDSLNSSEIELLTNAVSNNRNAISGSPQNIRTLSSLYERGFLTNAGIDIRRDAIIKQFVWKKLRNDPRFHKKDPAT